MKYLIYMIYGNCVSGQFATDCSPFGYLHVHSAPKRLTPENCIIKRTLGGQIPVGQQEEPAGKLGRVFLPHCPLIRCPIAMSLCPCVPV